MILLSNLLSSEGRALYLLVHININTSNLLENRDITCISQYEIVPYRSFKKSPLILKLKKTKWKIETNTCGALTTILVRP